MISSELENFGLYVDWVINTLKTQDKAVTEVFKRGISTLVSQECIKEILISALYYLAETDAHTFVWALHNYDFNLYLDLRQDAVNFAARKLINHGFVPGKDFSSLPEGGLMAHSEVKTILMQGTSPFVSLILQEVLQEVNSPAVCFKS